jgi:hypothetical protein
MWDAGCRPCWAQCSTHQQGWCVTGCMTQLAMHARACHCLSSNRYGHQCQRCVWTTFSWRRRPSLDQFSRCSDLACFEALCMRMAWECMRHMYVSLALCDTGMLAPTSRSPYCSPPTPKAAPPTPTPPTPPCSPQELTKSMAGYGFDIRQALVNDIAPAPKARSCAQ